MADSNTHGELEKGSSLWADAFQRLRKNRAALISGAILILIALTALLYEVVSQYGTGFMMEEQHTWVVPKPPGARSVPSHFYELSQAGLLSWENTDSNKDGFVEPREIVDAYRSLEFSNLDLDKSGALSYDEYVDAPLSRVSPNKFIPDCARWAMIKRSMAPIEDPTVFACDAGADNMMQPKETGKLVELVSSGEAQEMINRVD